MAEWPELSAELARKSLTTLEKFALRFSAGEITEREFWLTLDAMTDTIQGLVPNEAFDAIYTVRQALGNKK